MGRVVEAPSLVGSLGEAAHSVIGSGSGSGYGSGSGDGDGDGYGYGDGDGS